MTQLQGQAASLQALAGDIGMRDVAGQLGSLRAAVASLGERLEGKAGVEDVNKALLEARARLLAPLPRCALHSFTVHAPPPLLPALHCRLVCAFPACPPDPQTLQTPLNLIIQTPRRCARSWRAKPGWRRLRA